MRRRIGRGGRAILNRILAAVFMYYEVTHRHDLALWCRDCSSVGGINSWQDGQ